MFPAARVWNTRSVLTAFVLYLVLGILAWCCVSGLGRYAEGILNDLAFLVIWPLPLIAAVLTVIYWDEWTEARPLDPKLRRSRDD